MLSRTIRNFHTSKVRLTLQDYFDSPSGWTWSEEGLPTGRAWAATELRNKSFDDLHGLWWSCLKERNKLESQKQESRRFKLYFPFAERAGTVRDTMARVKGVLWERRIAYLQAQALVEGKSQVETFGRKMKRKSIPKRNYTKDKRNTTWTVI